MTEELIRSLRVIHRLERSIRILELVRDGTRQKLIRAMTRYETQGDSLESISAVTQALALIAVCNRTIRGARKRIGRLERGDPKDTN
jgi:exonuclease VII small subunit